MPSATQTVATDWTTIYTFVVRATHLNIEVSNAAGGSATSDFAIQVKDHEDGEFYDFLSGTDFDSTSLSNLLFASTTGPHELPAGSVAHVHVRINAAHAVRLRAKVASGAADVTVRLTAGGE